MLQQLPSALLLAGSAAGQVVRMLLPFITPLSRILMRVFRVAIINALI